MARMMTTSLICFCFCLVVVDSIVVAVRTELIGTVAAVRCKRERKNVADVRSFVLTATHTYTHTSSSATNTATSFICYREEKKRRREEGKEREKRRI
jgi:hypothetical protein